MSKLKEKLKKMSKTGKSILLAGATFLAGIGGAQAQTTDTYGSSSRDRDSSVTHHQKVDHYELQGGVLMPKQGETLEAYEARLIRLQQQEQRLRNSLTKNMRSRLASLQAKNPKSYRIHSLENRLEENSKTAKYYSYYSPEGQQRLQELNNNKKHSVKNTSKSSLKTAGIHQGRTYDF